ncbi:MAG: ATP-grasp domain-containing protein [Candidatus Rokubacteria bacterium]|nr:ATP-grasp domain-containing protein [Candidatus Rokubacteria bacterium]
MIPEPARTSRPARSRRRPRPGDGRKRLLLLIPTSTYRTEDFVAAASQLGVDLVIASERPSVMSGEFPDHLLTLPFHDPEAAARQVEALARERPIHAVVPVDDVTTVVGAVIAERLGLPAANPVAAVSATRNKLRMRAMLARAGVPGPDHIAFAATEDPAAAARRVPYPCVLKPLMLSASRGVIRADDEAEFVRAFRRIAAILADPEVQALGEGADRILVERFIPGVEVALEGLLNHGELNTLALFDKPDPLDGPFFEETIYVTPSRLPAATQRAIQVCAARAATALGLQDGPVHAELRLNTEGPWMLEIAARSIGGLCSRTLRFGTGWSLEEIILRHALGLPIETLEREGRAAAVMMIPIPRAGILEAVEGVDAARAVPLVEDVTISAHAGQELVPLPEGHRYLGFIFSRADTPAEAEAALRQAHACLRFVIR